MTLGQGQEPEAPVLNLASPLLEPPHITGSPEAVARPRLPHNVACGFPAPRCSAVGSQLYCYLFKFRFHGQLIFSLSRRP